MATLFFFSFSSKNCYTLLLLPSMSPAKQHTLITPAYESWNTDNKGVVQNA